MAASMTLRGRWRTWTCLLLWLVLLAAALPFAVEQSRHLTSGGYQVPGSQSATVSHALHEYKELDSNALAVLISPRRGATGAAIRQAVESVQRVSARIDGLALPARVRELAIFSSDLIEPVVLPLTVTGNEARAQALAEELDERLPIGAAKHGVELHLLGEGALWAGLDKASKQELSQAEQIGFPVVFIVLLTIFGSLSAAALPLALGAVAVLITGAVIYFISLSTELSVFVTNSASMLGIGVAVDYSLIVVARMRQELRGGRDVMVARDVAMATSGRAVIFSGLTVIGALLGVFIIPIGAVQSIALGAIIVVGVAVLTAVTLLPALMSVLGGRRLLNDGRRGIWAVRRRWPQVNWGRWVGGVTRRPWLVIASVGGLFALLCIPALSMRTQNGALDQLGRSSTTRRGFAEAAKLEGAGALDPVYVWLRADAGSGHVELRGEVRRLRMLAVRSPIVRSVSAAEIRMEGRAAMVSISLASAAESADAKAFVKRLRARLSSALRGTRLMAAVGGTSATQIDEEDAVAGSMWKVIAAVLILAFVILTVVLRSLVLPLKALLMNLLSVGAAYGVLVIVFQWGWLDSVFGYHHLGYLNTFTPPLILAVVFGLSMDYEVFLLSRVRERWLATRDAHRALTEGVAASAGTISGAAFILVCVFAVFIGTSTPSVKELGLGAAVAVGLDATLIRLVLVPAVMEVLGERNWWLPAAAARWLPARLAGTRRGKAAAQALRGEGAGEAESRS